MNGDFLISINDDFTNLRTEQKKDKTTTINDFFTLSFLKTTLYAIKRKLL